MATTTLPSPSNVTGSVAPAPRPAVQLNYGQLPHTPEPSELPPWQRPADWLELPEITADEQKLVGLFAVFPGPGNVLALRAAGNYCVDWGDGTVVQVSSPGEVIHPQTQWFANNFYGPLERMSIANPGDVQWQQRIEGTLVVQQNGVLLDPSAYTVGVNPSTNNVELVLTTPVPDGVLASIQAHWQWGEPVIEPVKVEHRYDHDAIPAAATCSRGYRQVIVTVTPQPGSYLTLLDLSPRHSSISQDDASCPWLDLRLSLPRADAGASIVLCGYESRGTYDYLGSVERIEILDAGGASNFNWLLYYASALQAFHLLKAPALELMNGMFTYCSSITAVELPALPQVSTARECFYDCRALQSIRLVGMAALSDATSLIYGCLSLRELQLGGIASLSSLAEVLRDSVLERVWIEQATALTSAEELFAGCIRLREVTITGANAITSTRGMFRGCRSLVIAPTFNTGSVVEMDGMFQDCSALQQVPLYDTSSMTSMVSLFAGCRALETIPLLDTRAVTTMASMFDGCWALERIPLLDTSAVRDMTSMFASCWGMPVLPPLNTAAVTSMQSTFSGCYALLQIPALNVAAVETFENCFSNCVVLAAAPLQGIARSLSFWGCALDRAALLQLFSGLATVSDGQSLDVSSNPGLAELTEDDRQIATGKGWTLLS
jgi:hypothetical protein